MCHDAGLTNREKTHNTRDCYSKPENKDKAPKPRSTGTASTQGGGSSSGSKGKANGNAPGKGKYSSKELRNRLIELLGADSEDDEAAGSSSQPAARVSTAQIREWASSDEEKPPQKGRNDDEPKESGAPSEWRKRAAKLYGADFPKAL